jgi:hypothetical protein
MDSCYYFIFTKSLDWISHMCVCARDKMRLKEARDVVLCLRVSLETREVV